MSDWQFIVELIALASLAGFLWVKHRQRERNLSVPLDPALWTGKTIDVTQLTPYLEQVRKTYLIPSQPPKGACFHRALLTLARRSLARFAYFHDRTSEEARTVQGD